MESRLAVVAGELGRSKWVSMAFQLLACQVSAAPLYLARVLHRTEHLKPTVLCAKLRRTCLDRHCAYPEDAHLVQVAFPFIHTARLSDYSEHSAAGSIEKIFGEAPGALERL